jgi:xanthine dehydrogenase accessory factor
MAFDREAMIEATHVGPVARILIVDHKGSAPRHSGTSMLVWGDGTSGTIGGGALELRAVEVARDVLVRGECVDLTIPLGPALGQCCGGSVRLVIERFDSDTVIPRGDTFVRSISQTQTSSLSVKRLQVGLRNKSKAPKLEVVDGWLFEPIKTANRQLWLYGAGHVGRAIVDVLDGMNFDITWVDTGLERFPENPKATPLAANCPSDAARLAPKNADHLIMTYSHVFDLELCHQILSQPHRSVGVIGSATKWARFSKRLGQLGHGSDHINTVMCPIGDPTLGNEPKAIAIGVAATLINQQAAQENSGREFK